MFGFPSEPYKTYNRNFLKTVIFQVSFNNNNFLKNKKSDIIDLFKETFPRYNDSLAQGFEIKFKNPNETPVLQSIQNNAGIEMRSNDGQRVLTINDVSLSLTISGKVYKNFDLLKQDLSRIDKFFTLVGINKIIKVAIRKVNIIEFQNISDATGVLSYAITPELLSNLTYFPKSEGIKQNIHSVSYALDNYKLNLKYGLILPQGNNIGNGQIILDIDLINNEESNTSTIFEKATFINNQIFNIFNWAISKNFKDLLNG